MKKSKPKAYRRLDKAERAAIERGLDKRKSCRQMARELGRSPSTVADEVARNRTVRVRVLRRRAAAARVRQRHRRRPPRRRGRKHRGHLRALRCRITVETMANNQLLGNDTHLNNCVINCGSRAIKYSQAPSVQSDI